jgi:hypothetical protein
MTYGADGPDLIRHAATFVHEILRGEKPAHLPVEQPIKFELVINLKTAKALGLAVPPALLARSDDLIIIRGTQTYDPYAAAFVLRVAVPPSLKLRRTRRRLSRNNKQRWLWVPAFAGTTGKMLKTSRNIRAVPIPILRPENARSRRS